MAPERCEHLFAKVPAMTSGDELSIFLMKAMKLREQLPEQHLYIDELVRFVRLADDGDRQRGLAARPAPRAWPAPSAQTARG